MLGTQKQEAKPPYYFSNRDFDRSSITGDLV